MSDLDDLGSAAKRSNRSGAPRRRQMSGRWKVITGVTLVGVVIAHGLLYQFFSSKLKPLGSSVEATADKSPDAEIGVGRLARPNELSQTHKPIEPKPTPAPRPAAMLASSQPSAPALGSSVTTTIEIIPMPDAPAEKKTSPPPSAATIHRTPTDRTTRHVNLLAMVDPTRDSPNSGWEWSKTRTLAGNGTVRPKLEFPYVPPAEYDFRVVFTCEKSHRIEDGVKLVAAHGERQCAWLIGGFSDRWSYVDLVDNRRGAEQYSAQWLAPGQRYSAVLRVRNSGIEGYLNDISIFNIPTQFDNVTRYSGDTLKRPDTLGFIGWRDAFQIESAEIIEVSGAGKSLNGVTVAYVAAQAVSPEFQPRKVDLLPYIDIEKGKLRGNWKKNASSVSYDADDSGAIRIGYEPPADYDFTLDFTVRRVASFGDLAVMLPHRGYPCMAVTGADGNKSSYIRGIRDDAAVHTENQPVFTPNQTYRLVAQMRSDGLTVLLDGKLVSQSHFTGHYAGGPLDWFYVGESNLGIGTFDSILFQRIELTELSGPGRAVELPPFGEPTSLGKEPPNDRPTRIVNLMPMIDPRTDAVKGTWTISTTSRGMELRSDSSPLSRLRIKYAPPLEYDFRMVFTREDANHDVVQLLPHNDSPFLFMWGERNNAFAGFGMIDKKFPADNETGVHFPGVIANQRRYTSIIHVRKNFVAASLDGRLISEYRGNFSRFSTGVWDIGDSLGVGSWKSPATFHEIEIAEITGEGKKIPSVR